MEQREYEADEGALAMARRPPLHPAAPRKTYEKFHPESLTAELLLVQDTFYVLSIPGREGSMQ